MNCVIKYLIFKELSIVPLAHNGTKCSIWACKISNFWLNTEKKELK